MNDSTKFSNGFKLGSLARLPLTKDATNEKTFLDLVENTVRKHFPHFDTILEDLAVCHKVTRSMYSPLLLFKTKSAKHIVVNVEQLQTDSKKFIQEIENVQRSIDTGLLSEPKKFHPLDKVIRVVVPIMPDARDKAVYLKTQLDNMAEEYEQLLRLFGEDPRDEQARSTFFTKIVNFLKEYQQSRDNNLESEKKKKEYEARRKYLNPGNTTAAKLTATGGPPPSPTTSGAMDSLLERLRAAAPEVKNKKDARRRARLRSNGQKRLASNASMLSMMDGDDLSDSGAGGPSGEADDKDSGSPTSLGPISESAGAGDTESKANGVDEDMAQKAKAMLLGLRGNLGDDDDEGAARRRRESAEKDRKSRRERRARATGKGRAGSTGAASATDGVDSETNTSPTGTMDAKALLAGMRAAREAGGADDEAIMSDGGMPTPTTVISPPPEDVAAK